MDTRPPLLQHGLPGRRASRADLAGVGVPYHHRPGDLHQVREMRDGLQGGVYRLSE